MEPGAPMDDAPVAHEGHPGWLLDHAGGRFQLMVYADDPAVLDVEALQALRGDAVLASLGMAAALRDAVTAADRQIVSADENLASAREVVDQARSQRMAAERIAERLRRQVTRRWHDDAGGRRLDVRRTLRASLRTGGVPVRPAWRTPRIERPRLFVLVDVSRSMETHAQLFLRIARAFVQAADARVFVFHTRLAEVTPLLRRDSGAVQEKVNAVTAGFGGGTRIATSLDDFTRVHARGQLGRRARVWILSDGFDADPPDDLHASLQRLRGGGARIAWFHPAPTPPASEAVAAARPLIDRFVRLATLRDLEQAATVLR